MAPAIGSTLEPELRALGKFVKNSGGGKWKSRVSLR